ncbi:MAG: class I SAM-dependent methyltransferase [Magnetococcales bacterium]|nr:class I SAM-dependent methyltransferase [Magnetococcales bacterium]
MTTHHENACPICKNSSQSDGHFQIDAYRIYTCPRCQTRFCLPTVDNAQVYSAQRMEEKPQYFESVLSDFDMPDSLSPYLTVKGKRVLDIGCATGSFLKTLQADNEILGLEIGPDYGPILEQRGIPHRIGDLSENLATLADDSYDLITLLDVFEHFEDPMTILQQLRGKLAPGGFLVNWTNNYDDLISLGSEVLYRLSGGRITFFMEQSFNRIGGHNFNFKPETMDYIYDEMGFEIVESIITDTPAKRLTSNLPFRLILSTAFVANRLVGKGKIIAHVVRKNNR